MTSKQALEKIRNIELRHTEFEMSDFAYSYEVFEGTIEKNYTDEIQTIEKELDKLADLEEIEEELGIDLITLFEALKNGIWIKKQNLLFFYKDLILHEDYLYICPLDIYDERVSIHQYGKTWALTEKELL